MAIREIRQVRIDKIWPNRRLIFEEESILRLCDDIRCNGLKEPIILEESGFYFLIIDGEKRWRACKKIGMRKIQAEIILSA
ncbi:MAG TPA: ParB N-terminal domain-containing protein [Dehalococcoidia bacterium]|jgi:ParB family chromosome partitioning protein